MQLEQVLTDRGSEYCGPHDDRAYQLALSLSDIDHTKTKVRSTKTNGICERFLRTMLEEFYQVAFRKQIYGSLDELQADVDRWLKRYNEERTHQGKTCCGRAPRQAFLDGDHDWNQKHFGGAI